MENQDYDNLFKAMVDLIRNYVPAPVVVPPAVGPVFSGTKTGMNLAGFGHYGNNKPFNNIALSGNRGWYVNGAWDTTIANPITNQVPKMPPLIPDDFWRNIVHVTTDTPIVKLRPGKYHAFFEEGFKCSLMGSGLETAEQVGPTESMSEATEAPSINIWVQNISGGSKDFLKWAIVHESDIEDYKSGKLYNRLWVKSLLNPKVIRNMDWMLATHAGIDDYGKDTLATIEPEHLMPYESMVWAGEGTRSMFMPPEAFGILARETGADMMMSIPAKMSEEGMKAFITRFNKGHGPDYKGTIIVEGCGFEMWNRAFPWGVTADEAVKRIAPTIKVISGDGTPSTWSVDQQGCVAAELNFRAWRLWEAVYGRPRVGRMVCGQFYAGDNGGMGGMFQYVDPISGARIKDYADLYGVAPYWGMPYENTPDWMLANKAWELGDQWWIDKAIEGINVGVKTQLPMVQEMLAKTAPKLKLTMYEGGGSFIHDGANTSHPDFPKLQARIIEVANGQAGATVLQYYWDDFIKGNFIHYMHFTSHEFWAGNYLAMRDNPFRDDTPREALFRTLGS